MSTNPANERQRPPMDSNRHPYVTDNGARSMSLESREDFSAHGPKDPAIYGQPMHSSDQHSRSTMHSEATYSPRFLPPTSRMPGRRLESVVTTSFSHDEERDDAPRQYREHVRFDRGERYGEERESWNQGPPPPPPNSRYYAPSAPSPKSARPYIHRAYSSQGYFVPQDTMKRSYFHHSSPSHQRHGDLPPEFMPPAKRSRNIEPPPRKEILVSPREHSVHRTQSFPVPPQWSPSHQSVGSPHHQPGSPSVFRGSYQESTPHGYMQVSPPSEADESPRSAWSTPRGWTTPGNRSHPGFWESPRHHNSGMRSIPESRDDMEYRHQLSRSGSDDKMRMMVEAAAAADPGYSNRAQDERSRDGKPSSYMLLAMPQDRVSLSETLCVVRENIEVFRATQADVDAPAPGRKHAVVVGQVGLRCIHCRHTTKCSDRVKRAVCYPSSIKRIYRTVIDMKLDHFSQCKYVPNALKNRLDELKAVHTRSTGTTMQYFIQAAHMLGMEDGKSGVRLRESNAPEALPPPGPYRSPKRAPMAGRETNLSTAVVSRCDSLSSGSWVSGNMDAAHPTPRIETMSSGSFEATGSMSGEAPSEMPAKTFEGLIPLSLPEDKTALSPLRCFLREQVCAFSATEKDIAVRAPTTFSITVGQVGIGCIHCVKQTANSRSNRSVCFPFSIARIYQSVADIQRFHFGECKMMPADVKQKFLELQSASSKGSKGLATRQYWVTSAKKIGLVDTPKGIRFGRDPSKPETGSSFSLDILAQAAFSVTTASKQLVLPEDKPCIAEFLYVVMEQLQPCRFTEADRNKRRLKDVGCIGVECKY